MEREPRRAESHEPLIEWCLADTFRVIVAQNPAPRGAPMLQDQRRRAGARSGDGRRERAGAGGDAWRIP